jgi:hypothetical protein
VVVVVLLVWQQVQALTVQQHLAWEQVAVVVVVLLQELQEEMAAMEAYQAEAEAEAERAQTQAPPTLVLVEMAVVQKSEYGYLDEQLFCYKTI